MKHIVLSAITALTFSVAAHATPVDPFTGFVGIGDSLSDKGRFGMLQPPSLGGRFSDGPTWMEILGAEFTRRGLGNFNMALGGATAGPVNANDPRFHYVDSVTPRDPSDPDDIPLFNLRNFSAQVDAFVTAGFDGMVGGNPLVSVLLGGNDFLQNILVNPLEVVGNIRSGIEKMAAVDDVFDSFMVVNLPRFSLVPVYSGLSDVEKFGLDSIIMGYNQLLAIEMADLAADEGLEIEMLDIFEPFGLIYQSAAADGLNDTQPCTATLSAAALDPNNQCLAPGSSEGFLFVDAVHPGSYAHSRLGAAAVEQISDRLAPVPLPAGLPLLVIGLGALGVLRQRRA